MPKTEDYTLREYLEWLKAGWIAEIVPLRLGVPKMSQLELRQDPETWEQRFWVLRCGGLEEEEGPPNLFLEVVKLPAVSPSIQSLSRSSRSASSPQRDQRQPHSQDFSV